MKQIFKVIKRHKQLLPLLVLTAYCIYVVIAAFRGTAVSLGEAYDFELQTKHYLAFGAVAINFLTYFFSRKFYVYTFGLTLVIAIFNLVLFSAFETTYNFRAALNSINLEIGFPPAVWLAALLAYIINFNRINKYFITNLFKKTPEEAERYEKELFVEQTEKFKERYKHHSTEDLNEIVTTNKLVPPAIEAAHQLLNERQGEDANRANTEWK